MIKYSCPTRYDIAPFGEICVVKGDNNQDTLYIQTAQEGEPALWLRMGEFLEKVFEQSLMDPEFIKDCLIKFRNT